MNTIDAIILLLIFSYCIYAIKSVMQKGIHCSNCGSCKHIKKRRCNRYKIRTN